VDRSRPVGALTKPVSWSSSSSGEGENGKVTLEGEVPGVAGVVSRVGSSAKPLDVDARGAKGWSIASRARWKLSGEGRAAETLAANAPDWPACLGSAEK
jgi:hypothetical protein